jgi:hypothetical protein
MCWVVKNPKQVRHSVCQAKPNPARSRPGIPMLDYMTVEFSFAINPCVPICALMASASTVCLPNQFSRRSEYGRP